MPTAALANAHSLELRRWSPPRVLSRDLMRIRFFVGLSDPVFTTAQTQRFSQVLRGVQIIGYPGHGHLLFLTRPEVFDDGLSFFQADRF